MDNTLFLMNGKKAIEMEMKKYEKEADLQEIIKDNPNLLTRTMEDGTSKKLYLVKQELSMKELEYGSISYSLDHFMVDEEGMPVLVEVKRSNDTRIKREVVAQMMDYASRASKWDIGEIQDAFEEKNGEGFVPNPELFNDSEEFWSVVSKNLADENFRLVFAADEIPDTLRILIEFLDRNLKDIEVYGVELKPYRTEDGTLLLAKSIIGNSTLDSTKATSSGKKILCTRTLEEFKNEFKKFGLSEFIPLVDRIYEAAEKSGFTWVSGLGAKHPSYIAKIGSQTVFRIALWASHGNYRAVTEFWISDISKMFNGKEDKETIRERLIRFHNKEALFQNGYIGQASTTQNIYFEALKDNENMEYFLNTIKLLAEDIQREQNQENQESTN